MSISAMQRYVIVEPQGAHSPIDYVKLGITQTQEEKNLSAPKSGRVVATLTDRQVAALEAIGAKVHRDYPVYIPPSPEQKNTGRIHHPAMFTDQSVKTHGADKLHAKGHTGKGVNIVVIDTGISPHKDLVGKDGKGIGRFYDAFQNEEVAPYDDHNHGTHCSGTAAAKGTEHVADAKSITGMAPGATLMGAKVLDRNGGGSLASVLKGMEQAEKWFDEDPSQPMVVSMSLGARASNIETDMLVKKVEELTKKGILFVIAAGNSGPRAGTIGTPGTAPSAITVGAMDTRGTVSQDDDFIARFSSRGSDDAQKGQKNKPNISARGVNVRSTVSGDRYATYSGTSMATPAVAGSVALLLGMAKSMEDRGMLNTDVQTLVSEGAIAKLIYDSAKRQS